MTSKTPFSTSPPRERAFMVGVEIRSSPSLLSLSDSLAELELLAETAGLEIIGETTQRLDRPHPATLVGSGKLEEIKMLVEDSLADVVLFDTELSPRHQRELEELIGPPIKVIDRTALILDIFAQHADTREGILQVELAQLEYRLPRLTRAWTHLARQAGGGAGRTGTVGGVGLRGPGETQLEVDRREIRKRISTLKAEIEKVRAHRTRHRVQRKLSQIPVVAIVGYTNSGKSTLLNTLAKTDVYTANQLFATLDPTTRRVRLPGNNTVLFTDTVGFIQKLPTQLIAAFRATLEEISEADLILHVVDITHPNAQAQSQSVHLTLQEIEADEIPSLTILNKIDLLPDPDEAQKQLARFPRSYAISAKKKIGIQEMLKAVENILFESFSQIRVFLPYQQGRLISLFHDQGQIQKMDHARGGITIQGTLPGRLVSQFTPFIIKSGVLPSEAIK
jgi:GTP-binding protein HflX